jgi:tetratricopeptide (TPR) repeat protein
VIQLESGQLEDWSSQVNTAEAYAQLGNIEAALAALHRSLRLAPDNAEVLFNAALVYSLAGQWPVALSYIQQSLSQGISPVWYRLAWFDGLCLAEGAAFNAALAASTSDQSNANHRCNGFNN